jgi:hypothetical protein
MTSKKIVPSRRVVIGGSIGTSLPSAQHVVLQHLVAQSLNGEVAIDFAASGSSGRLNIPCTCPASANDYDSSCGLDRPRRRPKSEVLDALGERRPTSRFQIRKRSPQERMLNEPPQTYAL